MQRRMRSGGFTLIEVIIVLAVGVILSSVAMSAFGGVGGAFAVRQARHNFAALHARARAHAIEFGEETRLEVDFTYDSVWISRGGDRIEKMDFAEVFGVDVQSAVPSFRLCMNPRGYADTSCNSFKSTATVVFAQSDHSTAVDVLPLGQLEY